MKYDIYEGIILKRKDPENRGRYYVYIPELQYNDKTTSPPVDNKFSGVWCYNLIGANFVRYTEIQMRKFHKNNSYGSYQPLRPGTHVQVGFAIRDEKIYWHEGYILNIITFEIPPNNDRDNFFLMQSTDKSSWAFFDESANTFGLSFHRGLSNVWGSENRIQLSKLTGTVVEVTDETITGFHYEGTNFHLDTDGVYLQTKDGAILHIKNNEIHLKAENIYINAGSSISLEAGHVHINDGIPSAAEQIPMNDVAKPSLDYIKDLNEKDENLHTKLNNGSAS